MRTYLWIAYAVVLMIVFWVAEGRNRPGGHIVATAPLAANRLIQDGDVRLGGGPLYLRRSVGAGERVRARISGNRRRCSSRPARSPLD